MHEASLAGGVLQLVEDTARREGFSRLLELRLEAGQLAGVDIRALRFALESLAPGTWYVNVLATYPRHRGRGHGTALLALADRLAADAGSRGLSIIVSNGNPGAMRLYERCGYRRVAERPMVKEGWQNPGTAWVLMVKPA